MINYITISITPLLSKVLERMVSVCLGRCAMAMAVLPNTHGSPHRGKVSSLVVPFCLCLTFYRGHWIEGKEARIVQIDSSAAFDMVNHQRIQFKLCSVGIEGSLLSVLAQFFSNRSQYVVVDGCRSNLVNVVLGVPRGSVLGPLLFLLHTA